MQNCMQSNNLTVLDHGKSVQAYASDLINHVINNTPLQYKWILPEWVSLYRDILISNTLDSETIDTYTLYHDCGKPFCLEIDELNRRHFPNHAEVSYNVFSQIFPDKKHSANLIRHDMDLHILKADQIESWFNDNSEYAITLLLVALAEVHANAVMFGGTGSTSFKIKWKCINQRGKQIINLINKKK